MTEFNAENFLISRHRGIFKSSTSACGLKIPKLSQRFESHDHLLIVLSHFIVMSLTDYRSTRPSHMYLSDTRN